MKLDKKYLAARALGVGVGRILFNRERLGDIQEAITKQDIRDLVGSGAIFVREVKGRLKHEKGTGRRRAGSVRKKVNRQKKIYAARVRKLRTYLARLKTQGVMDNTKSETARKSIKSGVISTREQLKNYVGKVVK